MTASDQIPETIRPANQGDGAKVQVHPGFGPALPEANWVPAPRYLMRRDLLLRLFGNSDR